MNERQWLECIDSQAMLHSLRGSSKFSERKARLFVAACYRRVWREWADERIRKGVEVTERYADGMASQAEAAPGDAARAAPDDAAGHAAEEAELEGADDLFTALVSAVAGTPIPGSFPPQGSALAAALRAAEKTATDAATWALITSRTRPSSEDVVQAAYRAEAAAQASLLRCLLGSFPPGPLSPIAPSVLHWHGGIIKRLAELAYELRELPSGHLAPGRLLVLADALEEGGCNHEDILQHLRGGERCPHSWGCGVCGERVYLHEEYCRLCGCDVPKECSACRGTGWRKGGVHVRGCWALDAVLQKE